MALVKLAELILDFEFYPRNDLSSVHVTALVDASETGVAMPPLIVDRKSNRVVDGFHRYRAAERRGLAEVDVEWRTYKTDGEMFADAVRLNAAHGRAFDPFDRRRAILRLAEYQFSTEQIAAIVHMPPAKLEEVNRITAMVGGKVTIVKGGLRAELTGQTLTKRQAELNRTWSGMNPAYHARQLVDLLKANVVTESPTFADLMDELVGLWKEKRPSARRAS